jgi:hypothetical protein
MLQNYRFMPVTMDRPVETLGKDESGKLAGCNGHEP